MRRDTMPPTPISTGVIEPSVSCPTITYPFSRPEDVHRLSTVRGDAELLAGLHHRLPDPQAVVGVDVDLEGQLAGEADAEDASRDSRYCAVADRHEGKRLIGEVHVAAQLLHDPPSPRPR